MTATPDAEHPDRDFDCLVFIGRFQPTHLGHLAVIHQALKRARQVIVLIGSAWQARSLRNPWLFDERRRMLRSAFDDEDNERLEIVPLLDALYNNDVWVRDVQRKVRDIASPRHARLPRIGLIGASGGNRAITCPSFPNGNRSAYRWSREFRPARSGSDCSARQSPPPTMPVPVPPTTSRPA